ncbi:MAG: hypothetical protein M1828_004665 [Chrysothrix sp. TS-e1954]|nr:MAG: hypothetical protein M1828_004665 [Chrysothrix sp. TS-e1954]
MSAKSLTDIARDILENATKLEDYFSANGLEQPSFDEHTPAELPLSPEFQPVRQRALDALTDLHDLLVGPAMLLRPVVWMSAQTREGHLKRVHTDCPKLNATSLQAIYKYDIASRVPLNGRISYSDLANEVGLEEQDVKRIIRFSSIHHRVFQESKEGEVSHTAASRLLAENPDAMAGLGFMFDECYQAFAHTVEALDKKPQTAASHNATGWTIANKTNTPMWKYHTMYPHLGERAGRAMAMFTKGFNHDLTALTNGYDWSSISAQQGLVVDLGGAYGEAAVALTRKYPGLQCMVQEIPEIVAKAKHQAPQDVSERVSFVAHDFFEPQETVARAYLFRQIFHNWSDDDCIKILRALVPALTPGAKVIVNDSILPPPGTIPAMQERAIRSIDMIMISLFNSREREKADWQDLFKSADSRFQHVTMWKPQGSQLGLIEATWGG